MWPPRQPGEGEGPFAKLVIRGATLIKGDGSPPIGPMDIVIIGVIILLLFGNRLPSVMRSLGRGVVEFKKGVSGEDDEQDDDREHGSRDRDRGEKDRAKKDHVEKDHVEKDRAEKDHKEHQSS